VVNQHTLKKQHQDSGGKKMERSVSIKICMVCVIMSLMLIVSCGKKKVETDGAAAASADAVTTTDNATDDSANAVNDGNVDNEAGDDSAMRESGDKSNARGAFDSANNVYFDYDSSDIQTSQRATLEAKGAWLKANPNATITIEGHCDERGTSEYNLALGDRRAARAKSFLEKLGISGDRMETVSYGEEKPAVVGNNEKAWSKNRRAFFADK
jgi:peptidoglycan-associated lipoprotein